MDAFDFSWDKIGDINLGRPNIGMFVTVETYRMMMFSIRSALVKQLGEEETKKILITAGRLAGTEFCKNVLDSSLPLNKFISQVYDKLLCFNIGIMKVENFNPETNNLTITISEDLDCSGLPYYGKTVCDFDEGFLEGIFNTYMGITFEAKEIDCWSTGERTCRFKIYPKDQKK